MPSVASENVPVMPVTEKAPGGSLRQMTPGSVAQFGLGSFGETFGAKVTVPLPLNPLPLKLKKPTAACACGAIAAAASRRPRAGIAARIVAPLSC